MPDGANPIIDFKYKLLYYGNTLCIKGKYDITGYDDNTVILKCDGDVVCITGENICISSLDADEIYLRGKISDISFS